MIIVTAILSVIMRNVPRAVACLLTCIAGLLLCLLVPALFCTMLFALNPNQTISQYAHTAWRVQDGVFQSKASIFAQTTDGYLWVGTHTGVLRFDGVRFVPWVPSDGDKFPPANIHALLGSRDGSLWIGTKDGLFRWKDRRLARIAGIPGSITVLVEDHQGTVWIARGGTNDSTGSICQVKNSQARCFHESDGIPAGISSGESLATDGAGNIWMGTAHLLLRWTDGTPAVYRPRGLASNSSFGIDALAASPDGSMWVGMAVPGRGLGLERLVHGTWEPFQTPQLDGSTLQVTDLFSDRDGGLWIGTADQGIYHYANNRIDHFRRADGLSGDFICSFFQDREGTLWVATSQGIDSFHNLSVTTWSAREGLTTDNAVSVAAGQDGTVWAGNAGGLDAIRENKVSSIRENHGLPGNQVRSIYEDREKRLWVGVDNDLTLFMNGRFTKILRPDGSSTGAVEDITEDPQGSLWIESRMQKELLKIQGFKVQEEFELPDIASSHVLTSDAQGNLWIGLGNGDLARFRNGRTEVVHFPHVTRSRVRQVVAGQDGTILAATSSDVLVLNGGHPSVLGVSNGLPCEDINGLVWDQNNNLWIHAACGLIEIEQAEFRRWQMHSESKVAFRSFNVLDGVQPGDAYYGPAARSTDGQLWFANGSILQMIDPAHLPRNEIPPPVQVEEIIADRKHYSIDGVVKLPKLTRDLEIDYTGLSLVAPQKVRFRYRLYGQDRDWQDAGARRQAFYTDLPPGNYQFRVIACNNNDVWNETGAAVSFLIAPAFYQTLWFRLLCLVALLSGIYIAYLLHLNRVTRGIREQLAARLEERERIARDLHDTLLQGFQGLMLRFQAVLKNIPDGYPARQMMENALDRADEVLLEGRQSVQYLREEGLTGDQLWDNLARWGKELTQDSSTGFRAAIIGAPRPLDPVVCDELYLIGREALSNAFRHASARHIEMEITYGRGSVRLIVRDDGIGVDSEILKSGRAGHWGLSGMRERARKIGAQLNIWSHSEAGTEIDLSIPAKVAYRRQGKKPGLPGLKYIAQ